MLFDTGDSLLEVDKLIDMHAILADVFLGEFEGPDDLVFHRVEFCVERVNPLRVLLMRNHEPRNVSVDLLFEALDVPLETNNLTLSTCPFQKTQIVRRTPR